MKTIGDLLERVPFCLASEIYGMPLEPIMRLRQAILLNGYRIEDAPVLLEKFIQEYRLKAVENGPKIGRGYIDG